MVDEVDACCWAPQENVVSDVVAAWADGLGCGCVVVRGLSTLPGMNSSRSSHCQGTLGLALRAQIATLDATTGVSGPQAQHCTSAVVAKGSYKSVVLSTCCRAYEHVVLHGCLQMLMTPEGRIT
mmetsp:Transcript_62277/g.157368  ORF Transcript_62277/g.157368 Transcript_62277/m.157368 type:complete len:124 (+) Transcript_62277:1081-1452(+)